MGETEYSITADRRLAILQIMAEGGCSFKAQSDYELMAIFETADRILHYVETGEHDDC